MTLDAIIEKESALQMDSQTYFGLLPEADRENVKVLSNAFRRALETENRRAVLIAVGGQLTKPFPRKDLDFLMGLEPRDTDPEEGAGNYYERSLANFKILRGIVERMISQIKGFKITKVIEPTLDKDFRIPSILRSVGSITIAPEKRTEIEIIRVPEISDPVKEERYAILAAV